MPQSLEPDIASKTRVGLMSDTWLRGGRAVDRGLYDQPHHMSEAFLTKTQGSFLKFLKSWSLEESDVAL